MTVSTHQLTKATVIGALSLLVAAACGGDLAGGATPETFFGPELSESTLCGAPAFDASAQRALFIYKDCEVGTWHLIGTAGATQGSYRGRLVSDLPLSLLARKSIEANDRVEQVSSGLIEFEIRMTSPWIDAFDFAFPVGATVRLEVDDSAGAPILAGAEQVPASSPVLLAEPAIAPCGAPTLNSENVAALYLYNDCESDTWHVRGTAGGASATYSGEIVFDRPVTGVQPYRLEIGDLLDTTDGTRIRFRISMVNSYLDGFDFQLPAGAAASLSLEQGGPLLVGESAESQALPFDFGASNTTVTPPPPLPPPPNESLDPLGCDPMTDVELRAVGYEPVRAHGALADDPKDDSAAIQAAIDAANRLRRVVYFHPGTYLVSRQLLVRQDVLNAYSNDGAARYGNVLLGSYCGQERPTLRLVDGVATTTNEQVISAEPFAVITLWRLYTATTPPDGTEGGRDWNQTVRNLNIVLGKNPGAVGIRHFGAEGSSAQEVSIDATGAFAGLYHVNSSGGYTYDVEVVGGRYGIYVPYQRGGSALLLGVRLSGQEIAPIASNHYTPMTLVGCEITHDDGRIISTIVGAEGSYTTSGDLRTTFHDSGGHVSMVDSRIEITGPSSALLVNTDRSVYFKNVYVRGAANVMTSGAPGGALKVSDAGAWSQITEYAYSGSYARTYGEESKLIAGVNTDDTFYDGRRLPAAADVIVDRQASPPADLRARHLYQVALCNVEGKGVVFVTDHGADPNTPGDDTAGIQASLDAAAANGSNRVFLPAGAANDARAITNKYQIGGTLRLPARTRLCGVSRYSSILSAAGWRPSSDRPVLESPDDAAATPSIADFKIELPTVGGSYARGYDPHVYAILWQSGRGSLYRDVYYQRAWGDPGDRRTVIIKGNGGGRFFGVTQHGGYLPPDVDPSAAEDRPFTDASGELVLSPLAQHLLIDGTREPLTFYPYHSQHMTQPGGALSTVRNAANVTFYGIKSEMGSVPEKMNVIVRSNPPELVPVWMVIEGSSNIALIGHEGMAQTDAGRGMIEVIDSSDITIANQGRRGNGLVVSTATVSQDGWCFVKEQTNTGTSCVTAQGFLSLFKSGN